MTAYIIAKAYEHRFYAELRTWDGARTLIASSTAYVDWRNAVKDMAYHARTFKIDVNWCSTMPWKEIGRP